MKTGVRVAIMVFVLAAGCSERPREATEKDQHAHEGGVTAGARRVSDNVLRIAPEMLRDVRVTTAPVEARPSGEGVTVLGELRVDEGAYAEVSPPIPARALQLLASAGEMVVAGQPLIELESVELGKARAQYLQARARAELARQSLARKRDLASDRILPRRELQEAEAELAAAQAGLQAAGAGLQALGVDEQERDQTREAGARFVLRSPLAGRVLERNAVRGQMVDPARPLFRVADLSRLWLVVHAYERDAVRARPGGDARVSFPALPGRTFTGTITLVGGEVDIGSRTVPVRIELRNEDGILKPGMSATAWLPLGDAGEMVVAVPVAALQRTQDGWCVFVPRGDSTFELRPVGRGRDLGTEVEILNGVRAGEAVVADGAFLLKAEADKARGEGEQHAH